MRSPVRLLALFSLAALLFPATAPAQPRDLLRLLDDRVPEAPAEAVQARRVEVDLAALGEEVRLPLLDGAVYSVLRTGVERRGPGELAWRGEVRGLEGEIGMVTLTASGGMLTGLISMPGAVYQVLPAEGGSHLLAEIDTSRLPPCGGPVAPRLSRRAARASALGALDPPPALPAEAAPTPIDLLVLYTPASRTGAGGVRQLRLAIQSSVDVANSAFIGSQIDVRLNLVGVREIAYPETGDAGADLGWLRRDRKVADLRREVGADVVSLFVERMDGFCGIGYVMNRGIVSTAFTPYAFNVVRRSCAPNMVLAHEVGHNLGCEHDPANGEPPSQASFPYSFGHFVDGSFRTIMSYSTECTAGCNRIQRFSNPYVTYQGVPTGLHDARDNHRTINNVRGITSRFATLQACRPGAANLCLLGKRFRVETVWENQFDGTSGVARAVPRTDAAGFFTFGDASNLELMVKLLDFGDAVKVFYGQLTNLRFSLIVTDTRTGAVKVYANGERECGAIDAVGFTSAGSLVQSAVEARAGGGSCRGDRNTLCLGRRFRVAVDWKNPGNGAAGKAGATALSPVTGAFYFTEASNLELLAKVLDFGDRIDFFYGALSDLEYTITVTDTRTGAVKTYHNPAGTYCGGLDDDAF